MTGDLTLFRRAGINRTTGRVEVDPVPGVTYSLPGNYNPDKLLERVLASRAVDLSKWEKQ